MTRLAPLLLILLLCLAPIAQDTPEPTLDSQAEQIRELTDRVRVLEFQLASTTAQLEERNALPNPPAKARWIGYSITPDATISRKGAFDMLEVCGWEGSQLRKDGPWNYTISFRYSSRTVVLDQTQFNTFAVKFDQYLRENP